MTVLGLIPARGGSKGIPKKNIKLFFNKPLIEWTIEAALKTKYIDRVVVSTDNHEIAEISRIAGAEIPFMRPHNLASDSSPTILTALHALEELDTIDEIIVLQPTSPLRSERDIEGIFLEKESKGVESIVSLTHSSKHPSWSFSLGDSNQLIPYEPNARSIRRQDLADTYYLNGSMYLNTRKFLFREKAFINKETIGYIMPLERSIDIDTELDFKIAEHLKATQS